MTRGWKSDSSKLNTHTKEAFAEDIETETVGKEMLFLCHSINMDSLFPVSNAYCEIVFRLMTQLWR